MVDGTSVSGNRNEAGATLAAPLAVSLAFVWLLARFVPAHSPVAPAVVPAIEALRVIPSRESGRYEVCGFPTASHDVTGLFRRPEAVAGRARLDTVISMGNQRIATAAERVARTFVVFPDEGVTGIRTSGTIIPFYDHDADRLALASREAAERPREALCAVAEVLDARLSEPPEGFELEDSVRRRDLMRLLREVQEAMRDVEAVNDSATARLQRDLGEAARRAEGPFRRRGPLRVAEIVLASLLGAALRQAVRPRSGPFPTWLGLAFAPPLATAAVLLLEGTAALPIDPLAGTAPRFIPYAFGIGFLTPALLAGASRLELRLRAAEPAPESPAPTPVPRAAPEATPMPAPPTAPEPPARPPLQPPAGREPPRAERLPFLPRRRRPGS